MMEIFGWKKKIPFRVLVENVGMKMCYVRIGRFFGLILLIFKGILGEFLWDCFEGLLVIVYWWILPEYLRDYIIYICISFKLYIEFLKVLRGYNFILRLQVEPFLHNLHSNHILKILPKNTEEVTHNFNVIYQINQLTTTTKRSSVLNHSKFK